MRQSGPRTWKVIAPFWCGWANTGWLTLVMTEAVFAALFFSTAVVVGSGDTHVMQPWKVSMLSASLSTVPTLADMSNNGCRSNVWDLCQLVRQQASRNYNTDMLYWSVAACAIIPVAILACTSARDEFTTARSFHVFRKRIGYSHGVTWTLGHYKGHFG